jgi:hypothetical protein
LSAQCEHVVERHYEEHVAPFFEDEEDVDDYGDDYDYEYDYEYDDGDNGFELDRPEEDDEGNWEDVSDDEFNDAMNELFVGPPTGLGHYDNNNYIIDELEEQAEINLMDESLGDESISDYDEMFREEILPLIALGLLPPIRTDPDADSNDEMPELLSE